VTETPEPSAEPTLSPAREDRKTLAAAARERRDIVSGEVRDEAALIRFVVGPDGAVVPDLGRKLPGRGLWVAADRASLETAAKKGLFSSAAKTKVAAPADLADRVEGLLKARVLAALGLARRSGDLVMGFEKVFAALRAGKVEILIQAADGGEDGRRRRIGVDLAAGAEDREAVGEAGAADQAGAARVRALFDRNVRAVEQIGCNAFQQKQFLDLLK